MAEDFIAAVRAAMRAPLISRGPAFPGSLLLEEVNKPVAHVWCGTARMLAFRKAMLRATEIAYREDEAAWVRPVLTQPIPSARMLEGAFKLADKREPKALAAALRDGLENYPSDEDRLLSVGDPSVAGSTLDRFLVEHENWARWEIEDDDVYDAVEPLRGLANILRGERDPWQTIAFKVKHHAACCRLDGRTREDIVRLAEAFVQHPTLYNLVGVVGLAREPTSVACSRGEPPRDTE